MFVTKFPVLVWNVHFVGGNHLQQLLYCVVSNLVTLIVCYECGWNLLLGMYFQQFLIDGQCTTMYSRYTECFQIRHINTELRVKYYLFKHSQLWMIFHEWTEQKIKYQTAVCDINFTFQVLDRQGWLQHDIAVHESFEGCCAKCGPGLDKWDTNSSRNTTSSRYTYGPCSSIWSLVCLKKLMRICIKKPCTNKL